MTAQELADLQRRHPFMPFAIKLTNESRYEMHSPRMLMVTPEYVVVAIADSKEKALEGRFERATFVSLQHISIEALADDLEPPIITMK